MIIFAGFCLVFLVTPIEARYADIADIPEWADASLDIVKENNIMTGFGDGTFRPNQNINRAEILTLIFRIKGIDPATVSTNHIESIFPDVPAEAWFEKAVIYATEQGWVKGFPDGNFYPGKELNKAELATLLQRAWDLEVDTSEIPRLSDVQEKDWFRDAVLAMYGNGLIRNTRSLRFFPENKVPRVEIAWIFAKIFGMPRLMGTSRTNNFEQTGRLASSRRVAIRRRDLNVNKQGYDIAKQGIYVNVYDKIKPAEMVIGSDWAEVGQVVLENTLDDKVRLDNISFRIRFDTGVGPSRNFMLRMIDQYNNIKEVGFPRNGIIFLTDWGKYIEPGENYKFLVQVKPKDSTGFYSKRGIGTTYLSELAGTGLGRLLGENGEDTGRTNYKTAPVIYKSRNFRDIDFNPVVE